MVCECERCSCLGEKPVMRLVDMVGDKYSSVLFKMNCKDVYMQMENPEDVIAGMHALEFLNSSGIKPRGIIISENLLKFDTEYARSCNFDNSHMEKRLVSALPDNEIDITQEKPTKKHYIVLCREEKSKINPYDILDFYRKSLNSSDYHQNGFPVNVVLKKLNREEKAIGDVAGSLSSIATYSENGMSFYPDPSGKARKILRSPKLSMYDISSSVLL